MRSGFLKCQIRKTAYAPPFALAGSGRQARPLRSHWLLGLSGRAFTYICSEQIYAPRRGSWPRRMTISVRPFLSFASARQQVRCATCQVKEHTFCRKNTPPLQNAEIIPRPPAPRQLPASFAPFSGFGGSAMVPGGIPRSLVRPSASGRVALAFPASPAESEFHRLWERLAGRSNRPEPPGGVTSLSAEDAADAERVGDFLVV